MKCVLMLIASAALLGCRPAVKLAACNIARQPCQEDIYFGVMRLRGDGWDPFHGVPPIRTLTLADYKAKLIAQEAQKPAAPQSDPAAKAWELTLQVLGLVTPSTSAVQASIDDRVRNVAAFYSTATRDVTVIDRGDGQDDLRDTRLLAHELVHAFQDSEQSGSFSRTTDGSFARTALIEGEAVLYERLAEVEIRALEPERIDWKGYYSSWTQDLRNRLHMDPSPFYAASWFVYPLGADLQTRAWLEGGNAAVRRLATEFPQHSHDYMTRLAPERIDSAATLACKIDAPAQAFEQTGGDRFGAMHFYAFLSGAGLPEPDAFNHALRWRDDLISVYFDTSSEEVAVSWRVRLANRTTADAIVTAITASSRPMLRASRDGNDLLIIASNNPDVLSTWKGSNSCKP